MPLKKWKRFYREVRFQNPYWSYLIDKFQIEDELEGEYHFVHTLGSTLILPITSSNKLLLVKQYRFLLDRESIEFPCGSQKEGISTEKNAEKELREETGFSAEQLNFVGEFCPYNGVADEMCSVFIGTGLTPAPLPADSTEEFEILEYSADEIDNLILDNIIWDGMSIAAWGLAKPKLTEFIHE